MTERSIRRPFLFVKPGPIYVVAYVPVHGIAHEFVLPRGMTLPANATVTGIVYDGRMQPLGCDFLIALEVAFAYLGGYKPR